MKVLVRDHGLDVVPSASSDKQTQRVQVEKHCVPFSQSNFETGVLSSQGQVCTAPRLNGGVVGVRCRLGRREHEPRCSGPSSENQVQVESTFPPSLGWKYETRRFQAGVELAPPPPRVEDVERLVLHRAHVVEVAS